MKTPRRVYFDRGADVPNSRLPVLIYRDVVDVPARGRAAQFRRIFRRNGWTGLWTDTIYDYTHFHSGSHEALGIAEGRVTLRLGGEGGRLFRLRSGDMVVLPAGVGHRRVGTDDGLKVIGAYPPGQAHFDMKRKGRRRPRAPLPATDPLYGAEGPLVRFWSRHDGRT
jgi:uncharacterized protein YjlB